MAVNSKDIRIKGKPRGKYTHAQQKLLYTLIIIKLRRTRILYGEHSQ